MLENIFYSIIKLFLEMAPYLLLGLFFVGLLHVFFSKEMILKYVGKDNFRSVLNASLFGVPLPLCSCGVIPTAVYMAKNGASKGAVISFLISTPQTGIDSMIATYGMLGWVFAIFRPLAAFVMGIFGGMVTSFVKADYNVNFASPALNHAGHDHSAHDHSVHDDDCDDDSCLHEHDIHQMTFFEKMKEMFRYSYIEFLDDIASQFIIGLIISGLIAYFIPDKFFSEVGLSNGLVGMLVMLAIGIPMYVCATASIPIAITLMMKGFSPGMAFVFLASGPATNAASLTILLNVIGKKLTILFVLIISFSSIVFGFLLDFIFEWSGIDYMASMNHSGHQHGEEFGIFTIAMGIFFLILLMMSIYRKYIKPKLSKRIISLDTQKIKIEGMSCNHCVMNVKKAISSLKGIDEVEVSLSDNSALIKGKFKFEDIEKAIRDVGYKAVQ